MILSLSSWSYEEITMKIYESKGFEDINIIKLSKSVYMNKKCYNSKKCRNLKSENSPPRELAAHPASIACKSFQESEYKILKLKSGNQMGFCRFKDGTMKNAWSLLLE